MGASSCHRAAAALLLAAACTVSPDPAAAAPSFQFISALHTAPPPITERRGYHFVLAGPEPDSAIVYACGINGELTTAELVSSTELGTPTRGDVGTPQLMLLNTTVSPDLLQSRAMLWIGGQLVVSNHEFLFYEPNVAKPAAGLRLVTNITTPMTGMFSPNHAKGGHDNGINGIVTATDTQGTTLLLGAAMPGILIAAALEIHGSPAMRPYGSRWLNSSGWSMGGAYDIDLFAPGEPPTHPAQSPPPLAVVVSPLRRGLAKSKNVLGVVQLHSATTGVFLPSDGWEILGALPFSAVERAGVIFYHDFHCFALCVFDCFALV